MQSATRRTYWRWRSRYGWDVLVHWSCAPVTGAAMIAAAIHLEAEYPGMASLSRWCYAGASGLLFFASVAIHEFGHLAMAHRLALEPTGVVLRGGGGGTVLRRQVETPAKEALFALAGPASNLIAAAVAGGMSVLLRPGPLHAVASGIAFLNVVLMLASVLPGYPLDGGLAVRAWRWQTTGDRQLATRHSRRVGEVSGLLLLVLGLIALGTPIGWLGISAGVATLIGPIAAHYARSPMLNALGAEKQPQS